MFSKLRRKITAEKTDGSGSYAIDKQETFLKFSELEPRIAFDAAMADTAAATIDISQMEHAGESETDSTETDGVSASVYDELHPAPLSPAISERQEVVFIDPSVENIEQLISGIDPGAETIFLSADKDGLAQISEHLAGRTDIDAIHIISHGDAGQLNLGSGTLNQATMAGEYQHMLAEIGASLDENADILIYGCNFGDGETGLAATTLLSQLTGADISSSDDLTGHEALGADWDLEVQTGAIETDVVVDEAARQQWHHTLATATFQQGVSGYSGTEDTHVDNTAPNTSFGSETEVVVDDEPPTISALMRFNDMFGTGPGQIPAGSTINSASLSLYVTGTDPADQVFLYEMLTGWNESSTHNSLVNGIQADDVEASSTPITIIDAEISGWITITGLGSYVQNWLDTGTNHGLAFVSDQADGWVFASSENSNVSLRPYLTVDYTANQPPVITSDGGGASASVNAAENQTAVTTVTSTDSDGGTPTYSISGGADAGFFDINSSTGVLTFLSAPDFESPADSGSNNIYDVQVQVDDGYGNTDTQDIAVTVTDANDVPVATGNTVVTNEETAFVFSASDFSYTDLEGDPLQSITVTNFNLYGGTLTHTGGTVTVTEGMTITAAQLADLTFTPAYNSTATASFDYRVNDVGTGANYAQMSITVNAVADLVSFAEDTTHTFSLADFTNDPDAVAIEITNLSLPAGSAFELNGSAVSVNDVIQQADISAGLLTFTPAPNENGNGYASIDFSVVRSTVTVLAGEPSGWTLGASASAINPTEVRLADTNLFGPSGTVTTPISVVEPQTTIDPDYLALGGIFFDGYVSNANYTAQEVTDIDTWVQNGGILISTNDQTGLNRLSDHYGLALTDGGSNWTVANTTHAIMNGPFGSVGPLGGPISTSAAIGYFNSSDLQPGDVVLAYNDNGNTSQPTIVLRPHGSGYILFVADVDIFQAGTSAGTGMTTPNDILIGNIFAWAANNASETQPGTLSLDVTPVNDAPVATGNTVATTEDTPLVIGASDFLFADAEGDSLQSVTISNLNLNGGTLTHTGGTVTVTNGMTITAAELADLTFTPALNSSASANFDYTVNDAGIGTVAAAMNINVTPVNDVPVATGNTVATTEDTPLVIGPTNFLFSDVEGDALQSVTLTNLSLNGGTLTHTGGTVTVTNGMTITAAELADLTFTPAQDSTTTATFDYTVNDAGSGVVAAAMNVNITPVNDVPVATGNTLVTTEDTPIVFSASDFLFTDVEGDSLQSVTISNLNLNGGTLTHTGGTVTVTNGMTITAAELADLTFTPAQDSTTTATFDYTVNDAGSGVVAAAMNINITPVNDGPVATGNTVATNEDTPIVFSVSDFEFTDAEGDALQSVTISNLNLNGGTLTHTGGSVTVTNGMTISAAELADLTFSPALGSTITATFDYSVNDAGSGTVTASISVFINSAGETVNTVEDVPHTFSMGDFTTDATALAVRVTGMTLPPGATLELNGSAVSVNDEILKADIDAGLLVFTPAADGNGTSYADIDFQIVLPTINVLAGEYSVWTLTEPPLQPLEDRLNDTNLFGPSGTVTTTVNVVPPQATIDTVYLQQGPILFDGFNADHKYTGTELATIDNWVRSGGILISTNEHLGYDPISEFYGMPSYQDTLLNWTTADNTHEIMNGPFGSVGPIGTTITNHDLVGYYDSSDLVAGDTVLAYSNSDPSRPTIVLRQLGSGYVLFVADVDVFQAGTSAGTGMTTPNDILLGNVFAWAINNATTIGSETLTINVAAVNDAPANQLPGLLATNVDTSITLSQSTFNAIEISDIDAGSNPVTVTLTASNGLMSLSGTTGLSFAQGDGTSDAIIEMTGTVANINAALDGLVFTPSSGFSGQASIAIDTDDLGNSGSGGSLNDSDTVSIQVGAASFQEGANGYAGTEDTYLDRDNPNTNFGNQTSVQAEDVNPVQNGLLRFDNLFGSAPGQVPLYSTIHSATISIYVTGTDPNDQVRVHEMLASWTESSTYNSMAGGIQTDDAEAASAFFATIDSGQAGWVDITLPVSMVQGWADGSVNHGIAFVTSNADGWAFASSEHSNASIRPYITIDFDGPVAPTITSNGGGPVASVNVPEGQTSVTTVTSTDPDGGTPVYSIVGGTDAALFSVDPATGVLTFNSAPDHESPADANSDNVYQVIVQVDDGQNGTDTQTIDVTVTNVNELPVATGNTVAAAEDTPFVFSASDFSFTDVEGDSLQSVTISNLNLAGGTLTHTGGTVTVTNGMTITAAQLADLTFTPALNSNATARFDYTVNDADPGVVAATMNITVAPVQDVATGQPVITGTVTEDQTLNADTSGIADADGLGTFAYQWFRDTGSGPVAISGATASTYTLGDADVGANISVAVSFVDGDGNPEGPIASASTAAVANVNDVPVANTDSLTVDEDSGATPLDLLSNDTDLDSDTLSVFSINGTAITPGIAQSIAVANGTVNVSAIGAVTFTPTPDYNGSFSFNYVVTDGNGGFDTGSVNITVNPIDDIVGLSLPVAQSTPEDNNLTFSTANGNAIVLTDPDGSTGSNVFVRLSIPTGSGTLTLGGTAGLLTVSGNGTHEIVMLGSSADITAALEGMVFSPTANWHGSAPIDIYVTRPNDAGFQNHDFELPDFPDADTLHFVHESAVPGWDTNASDGMIEIWDSGFNGVPAYKGDQFVELNGNEVATFSQTFTPTSSGSELLLTFAHRGRSGVDTMNVEAIDLGTNGVVGGGDDVVLYSSNHSTGNTEWRQYVADLGVASGNPILLNFNSVSAAGGNPTLGNFLDAVEIFDASLYATQPLSVQVTPVNDAPTGLPVITGTVTEDQTLTADTTGIADIDGVGSFSYQWFRDTGSGPVAISGATASTYTLGDADVTANITVQVSYTDGDGTAESLTSAATAPVLNVNDTPAGLPAITGSVVEDQTLTADTSGISDDDGLGTFAYQWYRNGFAISGATASSYTLGDADVGTAISVDVIYTDGNGTLETVSSAQTALVANVNDTPVGVPVITGTPTEDQTLTADTSGISDDDGLGTFSYQWYRDTGSGPVAVSGATASTYVLGDADVGAQMTVEVSYTDGWGTNEGPLLSVATPTIANVNDAPTGLPVITGTVTEDQTLGTDISGIADADGLGTFSYQWYRDTGSGPVAIAGATASTYTLGDADVTANMSVVVTYTDGHGTVENISSAQTAPVVNVNDIPTGVPVITGTVTEDQTLTADTSGIADDDGLGTFSYQWYRDTGSGPVAIAGATAMTYTLGDNDVAANMSVEVTYTDGHGTVEGPLTSAPTTPVVNVNDLPVATGNTVSTNEDTAFVFNVTDFAYTDIEGDALQSVTITNLNLAGGTLTHSGGTVTVTNGMTVTLAQLADLTFLPALNSNTNVSFDYSVNDADNGAVTATMNITVNPVNDVPVASGNTLVTDEDVPLAMNAGDFLYTDVEGDALQSVLITNLNLGGGTLTHSGGLITIVNNSIITAAQLADLTFNPAPDNDNDVSFDYAVNDVDNGTTLATMNITVNPVNDDPVIVFGGGGASSTTNVEENTDGATLISTVDVDGDPLVFSIIGGADQSAFSVSSDGTLTFDASPDFETPTDADSDGRYEVIIQVSDGAGGIDTQTVIVIVDDVDETTTVMNGTDGPPDTVEEEGEIDVIDGVEGQGDSGFAAGDLGALDQFDVFGGANRPNQSDQPNNESDESETSEEQIVDPPGETVERLEEFDIESDLLIIPDDLASKPIVPKIKLDLEKLNKTALWKAMDENVRDLQESNQIFGVAFDDLSTSAGAALSTGFVAWVLRGSALTSTLIASIPAWQRFDPIVIFIARDAQNEDEEDGSGNPVNRLLDRIRV